MLSKKTAHQIYTGIRLGLAHKAIAAKTGQSLHTIRNLKLKVGGIMVIEDVQRRDYWLKHITKTVRHKYSIESINLQKIYGQYDDFLIVLRNYGYF